MFACKSGIPAQNKAVPHLECRHVLRPFARPQTKPADAACSVMKVSTLKVHCCVIVEGEKTTEAACMIRTNDMTNMCTWVHMGHTMYTGHEHKASFLDMLCNVRYAMYAMLTCLQCYAMYAMLRNRLVHAWVLTRSVLDLCLDKGCTAVQHCFQALPVRTLVHVLIAHGACVDRTHCGILCGAGLHAA